MDAGVAKFTYTYDFGDDWRHTILVEAVGPADPALDYPCFIDGANRAPPEDVGGEPGFDHFLGVMADPNHPEHAEACEWNGDVFNPNDISEGEIIVRVGKLAKRRALGKAAYARSKGKVS
ncbi:plasmid pRiA4b ORF-3 family protein [Rhodoblastus sp. 17X3]|uniref:plasmid pRiA4b ORF-3 family protein n=1 Tax=Rhodoblastus sp. 17X3 TaxID=3047026 RepID=UPI00406BF281